MDIIFELSVRWKKSGNVILRMAGSVLYLIPRAYTKRLLKRDKKHEDVEEEIERRRKAFQETLERNLKKE